MLELLNRPSESAKCFSEAQQLAKTQGDAAEIARTSHFLALHNALNQRGIVSLQQGEEALAAARASGQTTLVLESYQVLSEVHARDKNFERSQQYFKQFQSLKDSLDQREEQKKQQQLEAQIKAERRENEWRINMAEEERQAILFTQLQLETQQKAQEVAFLRQQQELQSTRLIAEGLERERVAQQLVLAQQALEAEQRQQQVEALQRDREIKDLALKQKELEEKERTKAIELLETERQLQEERLHAEQQTRKYFSAALAGFAIFIGFILFSLVQRNKANKKLRIQQKQISQKNSELLLREEELKQNMEELQSTQEIISRQKEELQRENLKTKQSIQYAQTIQAAVLPSVARRERLFPESFLLYLPKDIVSGDFFWCVEQGEYRFAAVVDCTGHGVPGAFMSVVGNNLMNEIVLQRGETDPASVLKYMNEGIQHRLSQRESSNDDGMDMGIFRLKYLSRNSVELTYAGAKGYIGIVQNEHLRVLKGDRKSIGGKHEGADFLFTNHAFTLSTGDVLFMFSDGYPDQANPNRKSMGRSKFQKLLQQVAPLSPSVQHDTLLKALKEHQQDAEQRDDITVFGLRITAQ